MYGLPVLAKSLSHRHLCLLSHVRKWETYCFHTAVFFDREIRECSRAHYTRPRSQCGVSLCKRSGVLKFDDRERRRKSWDDVGVMFSIARRFHRAIFLPIRAQYLENSSSSERVSRNPESYLSLRLRPRIHGEPRTGGAMNVRTDPTIRHVTRHKVSVFMCSLLSQHRQPVEIERQQGVSIIIRGCYRQIQEG